jgi:hypothetical protein
MDLYDEADKSITRFSEAIKELADANQLLDEDQLIDFPQIIVRRWMI